MRCVCLFYPMPAPACPYSRPTYTCNSIVTSVFMCYFVASMSTSSGVCSGAMEQTSCGGAQRADLPAGKSVRYAGPVNRRECHTRIKRVMRHDPSSPSGTSVGGKTGYFAGPGNRKECACTFFPIFRAGKSRAAVTG